MDFNEKIPSSYKPHYKSPPVKIGKAHHKMDFNEKIPSSYKPHYKSPPVKIGKAHHKMDFNEKIPSSYEPHSYNREPIKKFISPKRKLHKKSDYDLDDFKKSSSNSSSSIKKRKSLKYKFVGKINKDKRQTLDDWSMSDSSNSF